MKSYTTKNGTKVSIDGDFIKVSGRVIHITHFYTFEESPERPYWTDAFRRSSRDVSEIGLVAQRDVCIPKDGNSDLISDIRAQAEECRKIINEKKNKELQEMLAQKEEIINSVPEGFELATQKFYLDGIVTFSAQDGATCSAWDDAYKSVGQGLFYIPTERFKENRERMIDKKDRKNKENNARLEKESKAFLDAKKNMKPVVLKQWTTDRCMNGNDSECSFDNATEWALPDGSRKITYTCCF